MPPGYMSLPTSRTGQRLLERPNIASNSVEVQEAELQLEAILARPGGATVDECTLWLTVLAARMASLANGLSSPHQVRAQMDLARYAFVSDRLRAIRRFLALEQL